MLLTLLIFSTICYTSNGQAFWFQPQQVHLSYGENVHELIVTWSTYNDTNKSLVEYGIKNFNLSSSGSSELFVDGGWKRHSQYIHRVKLTNLTPNVTYVYHCGSQLGWSAEFWFNTAPEDDSGWGPSLAIFGDMGNENAQSLARLQEETQRGFYDAILHVGDFAYDMDSKNAQVGDAFMAQIETIAAYLPYMTCPGKHNYRIINSIFIAKNSDIPTFNITFLSENQCNLLITMLLTFTFDLCNI